MYNKQMVTNHLEGVRGEGQGKDDFLAKRGRVAVECWEWHKTVPNRGKSPGWRGGGGRHHGLHFRYVILHYIRIMGHCEVL